VEVGLSNKLPWKLINVLDISNFSNKQLKKSFVYFSCERAAPCLVVSLLKKG